MRFDDRKLSWGTFARRAAAALLGALCVAGLSGLLRPPPALAQAARPNLSALIYSPDGKGASVRVFDPATVNGRELFKLSERFSAIVSPDANWVVSYGTVDDAGTFVATYGHPGDASPRPLPITKGFTFIGGSFSPSSRYFVFTGAKLPEQPNDSASYTLTLVELSTGALKQFSGPITYPTDANGKAQPVPAIGFFGGPITIGWLDDNRQVITPFLPFTDAPMDGVFTMDLSNVPGGNLPQAVPLTPQPITGFSYKVFAPDNTRMAYAYADPSRPVPNYEGPYGAFNTIGILDIGSGKTVTVTSPKDNAVGNSVAFSPDGTRLYFNVGPYVVDPGTGVTRLQGGQILFADTASGQVTAGPNLLSDPQSNLSELRICGSTLYFTTSRADPNTPGTLLIAAPLTDLTKQVTVYAGEGFVNLLSCAP